ncbi:predicted protein [Nematostella vectensis]|uniref:Uncharacterized protein n=1 Tax=Nematostella vectensis TaxID=45351 RepID=A7T6V6_NEMVE|nr:predicted protein [Nematostella vectensis]|eukprot:XP_001620398.1 hypothetical protein NEMVEDRAFT_v1g223160 [Nematostella vectensis]
MTGCLGKLSAQSQYAFVRCPACKHETLLLSRFNGIPSLPKNFGLLEIIESKENADKAPASASTIDQERAKHRHLCTEHDEPKKVYCYDDQVLICIYCQDKCYEGSSRSDKKSLNAMLATRRFVFLCGTCFIVTSEMTERLRLRPIITTSRSDTSQTSWWMDAENRSVDEQLVPLLINE